MVNYVLKGGNLLPNRDIFSQEKAVLQLFANLFCKEHW